MSYEQNCKICKHNKNYKLMNANVALQTVKRQDKKHQTYFGLLKAKKKGTYTGTVHPPHYRKKGGYDNLYIPGAYVLMRGDSIAIPMSREFRKEYGNEEIQIPIPPNVRSRKIHEVQIIPERDGSHIDVVFVYEQEDVKPLKLHRSNVMAIDTGVDNFVTMACANGTTSIIDGRRLKSNNQWYNKQMVAMQSKLPEGVYWSQGMTNVTRKRVTMILPLTAAHEFYGACPAKFRGER